MGFLGDLFHGIVKTITAPIEAVVTAGGQILSGRNLGAVIKSAAATTVSGSLAVADLSEKVIGLPHFEDQLSPFTLGITGDLAHIERFTDSVNHGHTPDQREINVAIGGAADAFLKTGAIVATAYVGGVIADAGYGTEALAAGSTALQFARGNTAGGIRSLVGGFSDQLPFDATPLLDAIDNQGKKAPPPVHQGVGAGAPLGASTSSGFDTGAGSSVIPWTVVGAVALGGFALWRSRRG